METTADSLGFVRGLPGRTGPEPALQPLGHRRSLEAPRGLADLARGAVQTYAGQEGMTLKRLPALVQALRWREEAEVAPSPAAPEEPGLDEPLAPEPVSVPDRTSELPPPAPPRPVVAVPLPVPITASRLTQAPLDLVPQSPFLSASPSPPAVREVAPAPWAGLTAIRTPAAEKDTRINLGQARRLGLGPPLPLPPPIQRSNADRESENPGLPAAEVNLPTERSEPIARVSAATTGAAAMPPTPSPGGAPPTPPLLRLQRWGAARSQERSDVAVPPPVPDMPLVADLPRVPDSQAVADSPSFADPSSAVSESPVAFAPSPASDSPVALGASRRELGLRFTAAGGSTLPVVQPVRESARSRTDLFASSHAGAILPLTAQRTPAAAQPALVSVHRSADRQPNPSQLQVREMISPGEPLGASAPRPDLPLAPLAPNAPADSPFEFELETLRERSHLPPEVQRATAAALHLPAAQFSPLPVPSMGQPHFELPPVQRAEADAAPGGDTAPAGAGTPSSGSAPGGGGAPGAAAAPGQSEKELDDLAHKLYDRLRYQLRSELLIDRERAGLLTDLR